MNAIQSIHREICPEIDFLPQLGFQRSLPVDMCIEALEQIAEQNYFYAIDLYGEEQLKPAPAFQALFRRAEHYGMMKYCHVGEEGTAEDVREAIDALGLDAIQHGIAAASDARLMALLANQKVPLHTCPACNLKLGIVDSLANHPIRRLLEHGVRVTINTDDVLLFDEGISEQWIALEHSHCLQATQLEQIRLDSLGARAIHSRSLNASCKTSNR